MVFFLSYSNENTELFNAQNESKEKNGFKSYDLEVKIWPQPPHVDQVMHSR